MMRMMADEHESPRATPCAAVMRERTSSRLHFP